MAEKEKKLKIKKGGNVDFSKAKSMQELEEMVNSSYGKGTTQRIEGDSDYTEDVIPTGHAYLDWAIGGGIKKGRIVEIYGPESSGKTTLALHIMAVAQMLGGHAAFIDAEHALDPKWAQTLGVDWSRVIYSQPNYGEQGLELMRDLSKNPLISVIVADSAAAFVPKAELDGQVGDATMGLQARNLSQTLRQITSEAHPNCIVIVLNQLRMKIGVMFGNPETTTSGNALKFYTSLRLDMRKRAVSEEEDIPIHNSVKIKVVKNKIAPPFRIVPEEAFTIHYGAGIQFTNGLTRLIKRFYQQDGSNWYELGGAKYNGEGQIEEALLHDPKARNSIIEHVLGDFPVLHKDFYLENFETLMDRQKQRRVEFLAQMGEGPNKEVTEENEEASEETTEKEEPKKKRASAKKESNV